MKRRRPDVRPPRNASFSTGFAASEPSAQAAVDAGELLVHHAAGADVEVPHLGVAHLPAGRPTASPDASSFVHGRVANTSSRQGVRACEMAFPGPGSARPEAVHDDKACAEG